MTKWLEQFDFYCPYDDCNMTVQTVVSASLQTT